MTDMQDDKSEAPVRQVFTPEARERLVEWAREQNIAPVVADKFDDQNAYHDEYEDESPL